MSTVSERIKEQQKNIKDLEQQLETTKKTWKKLGIILPTSTFVLLTLLISPYIKMATIINSTEQLLIILSYPLMVSAVGAGIMGLFKDKEKQILGRIETAKSILDYEKQEQKKANIKINKTVNQKYKGTFCYGKSITEAKITVDRDSKLAKLREVRQELMQEPKQPTYTVQRELSGQQKTKTKPYYKNIF